jgi:acyl carrier protein
MLNDDQKILAAVYRAVTEINQQRPEEKKISKSIETPLAGECGTLDSLGLICFLVAVEQELKKELRVEINLIEDEAVLSGQHDTLQNIGTLVGYITRLLKER